MRSELIRPEELRQHLVSKVRSLMQVRATLNDPTERQCYLLAADALEGLRHEFLNDYTFYDDEAMI